MSQNGSQVTEPLRKSSPVVVKKLSAFCGEYSNSTRIDERLGVLGNECFLNGLSFVPNIVFVLIAVPMLISWNKSIFASMHVKTWVRFPYHVLRWVLFLTLISVNILEVLAGILSDELLGGAHLHLFIPHFVSVVGTLVSVVYYHSVEMWNSPRFLLLLIPYWFFLMIVEIMKTVNLKLLDVSTKYMRPHFTRSSILIYLILLLIELDILRQIRYAFFNKRRILKAPDYLADTNYVHTGVSLPSKATFFWIRSFIAQACKKPLEMSDLGALPKSEKSGYNYAQLLACIEEEKERKSHGELLWMSMIKSCLMKSQSMVLTAGCFGLLGAVFHLCMPVLLIHIVRAVDNKHNGRKLNVTELPNEGDMVEVAEFFSDGYVISLLIFVCGLLCSAFNQAANFVAMREGVRMRGSVQMLIYSKVLSLSLWNFATKSLTSCQIVNHLTTDSNNLLFFYCILHLFFLLPVKCLLAGVLLYLLLGWVSIPALLVLLLLTSIQCLLIYKLRDSQQLFTDLADTRMRRCTELLQNIKCLKLYSWENVAKEKVLESRRLQIEVMKKNCFLKSFSAFISDSVHLIVLITVFSTLGLSGRLSHRETFPSIVIIEMLTSTVQTLPCLSSFVVRAFASNKLITSFLTSFEIDSNSHQADQSKYREKESNRRQSGPRSSAEEDDERKYEDVLKHEDFEEKKLAKSSRRAKKGKSEEIAMTPIAKKKNSHTSEQASHTSNTIKMSLMDVEAKSRRVNKSLAKSNEADVNSKGLASATPRGSYGKSLATSTHLQSDDRLQSMLSASNSLGSGLDDDDLIDPNRDVGVAVNVSHGHFTWSPGEQEALLYDVNFKADAGLLTLIVGEKGSGKSSLVAAVLGEMNKLAGTVTWKHGLTTCYAGSVPWILNNTVQENILFGLPMEKRRYRRVLKACALNVDIDILPERDATIIGDKGIVLSLGQRLRITIARAIYSKADLVILDDPFSALDLPTASHIFEDAILYFSLLRRRRTVVLVTHQLHFLPFAHAIYQVESGCLTFHGRLQDVKQNNPALFAVWQQGVKRARRENQARADREDTTNTERLMLLRKIRTLEFRRELARGPTEDDSKRVHFNNQTTHLPIEGEQTEMGEEGTFSKNDTASPFEEKATVENIINRGGLLRRTRQEQLVLLTRETNIFQTNVRFSFSALLSYTKSMGFPLVLFFILFQLSRACFVTIADVNLSFWCESNRLLNNTLLQSNSTDDVEDEESNSFYLQRYLLIVCAALLVGMLAVVCKELFHVRSSGILYTGVLSRVVKAPMKFFDSNPISKIITRLSGDIGLVDEKLPSILDQLIRNSFFIFSCFFINIFINPYFSPIALVISVVIFYYVFTYIKAYREVHRLESLSKYPLMSHISETLQGLKSIRAFKEEIRFWAEMESLVNANNSAHLWMQTLNRWISVRLDCTACLLVLVSCILSIIADVPSPLLALAATYALMLGSYLNYTVKSISEADASSPALQRLHEYSNLPLEDEGHLTTPEKDWPTRGEIVFQNVSISYPYQPTPVAKNISFHINPGEKIGICGKPGSGKSSLILSLFGMVHLSEGSIELDGVDIETVDKSLLRSRLSVLPQDCMLLQGSVRYNLDPENSKKDDVLWDVLEQVEMKEVVEKMESQLDAEVLENGECFSITEKQLLCIARAVLRDSRVVIIDEVMSVINNRTEKVLNRVLKGRFGDKTVINLSHRPASLLTYDQVLVLDNGCVVEKGRPEELLKMEGGVFASLLKKK